MRFKHRGDRELNIKSKKLYNFSALGLVQSFVLFEIFVFFLFYFNGLITGDYQLI